MKNKLSPYAKTPIRNNFMKYLDTWAPISIPHSDNDQEYIIESEYDENPAKLAHDLYGYANLYWVFTMRNVDVLIDPIADFKAGTKIMIPNKATIDRIF